MTNVHLNSAKKNNLTNIPVGGGVEGTWVNFLLDMCRWPLRAPTPL